MDFIDKGLTLNFPIFLIASLIDDNIADIESQI